MPRRACPGSANGLAASDVSLSTTTLNEEVHMSWDEVTHAQHRRSGERHESDFTYEEWDVVRSLLPEPSRQGRPRKTNLLFSFVADSVLRVMRRRQWRRHVPRVPGGGGSVPMRVAVSGRTRERRTQVPDNSAAGQTDSVGRRRPARTILARFRHLHGEIPDYRRSTPLYAVSDIRSLCRNVRELRAWMT